jgi:rhamnose utilization protein RhaD (predicted bifunctional aldolase and dehydrogenase)
MTVNLIPCFRITQFRIIQGHPIMNPTTTGQGSSTAAGALPFQVPVSRWSHERAKGMSPAELLLYRSNLLGSDLTVTNFGGGNTSAKLTERDPLTGEAVTALWVKGSGGDLGSMKLDGFSTLYLDRLLGLEKLYRGVEHEDEMVGYLPHCTFNLNPRAASIDTPLHGYLPFAHIDHVHPDAIIALAASSGGEAATREIWGGAIGWLGWKRPGFDLGLRLREYVAKHPGLRGVMLAGHGIICWGDSAKACYENTIDLIAKAAVYLNARLAKRAAFGGLKVPPLPADRRAEVAARLMPRVRGLMSEVTSKVGHFSDDAEALEFVGSVDFEKLAAIGTSCPDHFLRTKIAPLTLDRARLEDDDYLAQAIGSYRDRYASYYRRCA